MILCDQRTPAFRVKNPFQDPQLVEASTGTERPDLINKIGKRIRFIIVTISITISHQHHHHDQVPEEKEREDQDGKSGEEGFEDDLPHSRSLRYLLDSVSYPCHRQVGLTTNSI